MSKGKMGPNLLLFFSFIFILNFNPLLSEVRETYIIHVTKPPTVSSSELQIMRNSEYEILMKGWYNSFLPTKRTEVWKGAGARMVHTYRNIATGFAARLTPEEAKQMEKKEGFLWARPQRILSPHTTHTPDFLGLQKEFGFWPSSSYGKGVTIGVLDTGITPGHPSFSEENMPPPPAKWKGKCELEEGLCNNKIIGARNFVSDELLQQPVDFKGHGTHTASTAAGNFVQGANALGVANGTASGMAPLAHLAIYKVCAKDECAESDILAGMDAAVEDGVDVLSLSLGLNGIDGEPIPFYTDAIAIGAFGAIQKGIFVSCSAGNSGPFFDTVRNDAPWILTVGASTTNRIIRATTVLGNNDEFDGESLFQPDNFPSTQLPLVYAGMYGEDAAACASGSLNNGDFKGKIVLCEKGGGVKKIVKGQTVKDAGGAAMILMNEEMDEYSIAADAHVLPASHVSYAAGETIKNYIKSTSTPTATILFKGTIIGTKDAPSVASFSSRGPSLVTPGIAKPDIIGPGVNILAAWPNIAGSGPTFNIISGTSMSSPHLSGIAALLRSTHPDWSPAAIKSAIMTTADIFNLNNRIITNHRNLTASIFSFGAGHVNPSRATNPGLVYDIHPEDYISYLCGLGYKDEQIEIIAHYPVQCSSVSSISEAQLNYPSFSIKLGSANQTCTRTVTNVGKANSTYHVDISVEGLVNVSVQPAMLDFTEARQHMTYQITFSRAGDPISDNFVSGDITWVSDETRVRSPFAIDLII